MHTVKSCNGLVQLEESRKQTLKSNFGILELYFFFLALPIVPICDDEKVSGESKYGRQSNIQDWCQTCEQKQSSVIV